MGDDEDLFASLGGGGGGSGGPNMQSSRRGSARPSRPPPRSRTPEISIIDRPIEVSLEELFSGTRKRMRINRKLYDERTGRASNAEKILEVPIKPGLRAGSKIKFSNVGDQIEGGTQDIHFVVAEKKHERFVREADELKVEVEIDLKEALCGWTRTVSTIDGKNLSVGSPGPSGSGWSERFPGLGMPKSKKPEERGDFVVGVRIKFPTSLTVEQKRQLREIL